jgi:hypothetical protein
MGALRRDVVLMSGIGTERTNWAGLLMSVDWDRPEVTFQGRGDRFTQYASRHSRNP